MTDDIEKPYQIENVVVHCGSRLGIHPASAREAAKLGKHLGRSHKRLIYGGGASGLMGIVAYETLRHGGEVTGIITSAFKEANYRGLDGVEEIVVETLDERLALMNRLGQAFISLDGGFGTLHENATVIANIDMRMNSKSTDYVKPIIIVDKVGLCKNLRKYFRDIVDFDYSHEGRDKVAQFVKKSKQAVEKLDRWNSEGIMRYCDIPQPERKKFGSDFNTLK